MSDSVRLTFQNDRERTLWRRKEVLYKKLYDFTFGACGACVESGCACKDRICQHVQEQAARRGVELKPTGHRLRFIGEKADGSIGCTVAPHLRETCTIYVCGPATTRTGFDTATYTRIKELCAKVDWQIMELEEGLES